MLCHKRNRRRFLYSLGTSTDKESVMGAFEMKCKLYLHSVVYGVFFLYKYQEVYQKSNLRFRAVAMTFLLERINTSNDFLTATVESNITFYFLYWNKLQTRINKLSVQFGYRNVSLFSNSL